jgi:glyoxylase-like metal-dependent hydrolase (beta-lactamase superfamily II)
MRLILCALLFAAPPAVFADDIPDWCKKLPRPEYSALKRLTSLDAWFEIYEVRPGVFAIYEPRQSEEVISYLITGSARAILFDTGMGIGDMRLAVSGLTRLPVMVLNSHTHNDHVGGNWQFDDVRDMDTAFTRENAKGSAADAQAELAPGEVCGALPQGFDSKSYATKPWRITSWIRDGDRIDLGGRAVEILATPGHTPDSIALLDRENGLLFSGDTFYPAEIYLYRPETDLDAYERSMQRLAGLAAQVRLVLPSHNVPVADPEMLARVLAAFREVRAGKVKAVRRQGWVVYEFDRFSFRMRR